MAVRRTKHLKKNRSFALSQARRSVRIRSLKQAKSRLAARHALFFVVQEKN
ncbi:hypothetical protein ACT2CV_04590 [Pasteurellaceae bacterium 22721_9_1]